MTRTTVPSLPGYTADFRRWLRRDLAPWERRIITSIEYRRTHRISQYIYLGDDGTRTDRLIGLLTDYLRWRKAVIMPGADILVMDATVAAAARIARRITDAHPASGHRPASVRSHTFHFAMLLNVHADAWRYTLDNTLAAILPMLPPGGNGLLIVHGLDRPGLRTVFTYACKRICSCQPRGSSVHPGYGSPFDPDVDHALALRARPPAANTRDGTGIDPPPATIDPPPDVGPMSIIILSDVLLP